MAPSVLWIDADEIAALLGEPVSQAAPMRSASTSTSRQFSRHQASRAEPRPAPAPVRTSPPVQTRAPEPRRQPPYTPPGKPANKPAHKPAFTVNTTGVLEPELDRFLTWLEHHHNATCCYVADQDGCLVAARRIANASSPYETSGLLSQHLDEISALATAPLRGYCVYRTAQGYSTSTWINQGNRRFFLVLECPRALEDAEVDRARALLAELLRETR